MYAKISVKGADQAPLYTYLTKGHRARHPGEIKWNFTKFLVDPQRQRSAAFRTRGHAGFERSDFGSRRNSRGRSLRGTVPGDLELTSLVAG